MYINIAATYYISVAVDYFVMFLSWCHKQHFSHIYYCHIAKPHIWNAHNIDYPAVQPPNAHISCVSLSCFMRSYLVLYSICDQYFTSCLNSKKLVKRHHIVLCIGECASSRLVHPASIVALRLRSSSPFSSSAPSLLYASKCVQYTQIINRRLISGNPSSPRVLLCPSRCCIMWNALDWERSMKMTAV